jgi:hypothetical protein
MVQQRITVWPSVIAFYGSGHCRFQWMATTGFSVVPLYGAGLCKVQWRINIGFSPL